MRRLVTVLVLAALLVSGTPAAGRAADPACPDLAQLPPTPFTDLGRSVHRAAVVCAAWYDVASGTSASRFRPHATVRRDQMATFLVRLLAAAGSPLPSRPAQPFTDVGGSVHADAIAQVAELGLVNGVDADTYDPAGHVTRGQVAAFLARVVDHLGIPTADAPDAFDDDAGSTHERSIDAVSVLGLVSGREDGTFGATEEVSRAQLASFLARTIELLVRYDVVRPRPIPAFSGSVAPLPDELRRHMTGTSWQRGCPVGLDALRLVRVTHWGYDAEPRRGYLVVAATVAGDVRGAFRRIYDARFQIQRIRPVHQYDGDDDASMTANNTSAFNCRRVTGGTGWSQHSYGTAVDINPRQNPYVNGGVVLPSNAGPWVDRTPVRRGMISAGDAVTTAFAAIGWGWGGDYRSLKDWQHLSATGG